jgi:peptidyl-prolyl cis-trans isomerase SurA
MAQAGVTKQHFKEFIRAQMAWNQALGARHRAEQGGSGTSEQEMVRRMLEKGGSKPSATEYMLQQVIFVVPAAERKSTMAKRKREAEAMRARFNGCENTHQFAKGLLDVTVRDLGRVLAPQLPPEWADQIKKTKTGGATTIRETERGVEFIGICSSREVSDDKVAQMVFQAEGKTDDKADALSEKYLGELKAKARIVKR